ncbi:MAG: transcription antitermination factor NusB [Oscillospiraceae bacterium]|nr:transcription antitermination factor NusB [Oscillospiraceae bacterium]
MSRKKAREIVLCLVFLKNYRDDAGCEQLYNELFENCSLEELYTFFGEKEAKNTPGSLREADCDYIKNTFFGVFENIGQIDEIVSRSTVGWQYGRISKISTALLRIAAYELMYARDIPVSVAINEALELSKRYDDPEAYIFVNGVLGAVVKTINNP